MAEETRTKQEEPCEGARGGSVRGAATRLQWLYLGTYSALTGAWTTATQALSTLSPAIT